MARGEGRIYKRGAAWWIAYYVDGMESRESVSRVTRKLSAQCTQDDAKRALEIRLRQKRSAGRRPFVLHDADVHETVLDTLTTPPITLKASDLRAMFGPIVYAYVRNGHALYVGMSGNGLERPFDAGHHVFRGVRQNGISDRDHLVIWPTASEQEARILERRAIAVLLPEKNCPRTREKGGQIEG